MEIVINLRNAHDQEKWNDHTHQTIEDRVHGDYDDKRFRSVLSLRKTTKDSDLLYFRKRYKGRMKI